MSELHGIRLAIKESLDDLCKRIGAFRQTTHGAINRQASIEDVAQKLIFAYNSGTAFNLSELSQSIKRFVNFVDKQEETLAPGVNFIPYRCAVCGILIASDPKGSCKGGAGVPHEPETKENP